MAGRGFGSFAACAVFAGLALPGCNPLLDAQGSAEEKPAVEATALGTWRSAAPSPDGGHFVRMTLRVDSNHTMLWARRYSANPAVQDTEYARETWSWKVEEGILQASKTHCSYAYLPGYLLEEAPCREPLAKWVPVKVKGNSWLVEDAGEEIVFRKD
jgi:hypothetical protein